MADNKLEERLNQYLLIKLWTLPNAIFAGVLSKSFVQQDCKWSSTPVFCGSDRLYHYGDTPNAVRCGGLLGRYLNLHKFHSFYKKENLVFCFNFAFVFKQWRVIVKYCSPYMLLFPDQVRSTVAKQQIFTN